MESMWAFWKHAHCIEKVCGKWLQAFAAGSFWPTWSWDNLLFRPWCCWLQYLIDQPALSWPDPFGASEPTNKPTKQPTKQTTTQTTAPQLACSVGSFVSPARSLGGQRPSKSNKRNIAIYKWGVRRPTKVTPSQKNTVLIHNNCIFTYT